MMREGQVFYADYAQPEGFCDEARKAVCQYVFAPAHGTGVFYYGDWIDREAWRSAPATTVCGRSP